MDLQICLNTSTILMHQRHCVACRAACPTQVMSKFGSAISPAALDAMPYADAVIREALRIAPPSASVFRRTTVDMEVRRTVWADLHTQHMPHKHSTAVLLSRLQQQI